MYCITVPRTFVQDVVIIVLFVSRCSPAPATPPPKEEEWSDVPSDVVHLADSTFDDFIANNPSVLVMFYAPCKCLLIVEFAWCTFYVLQTFTNHLGQNIKEKRSPLHSTIKDVALRPKEASFLSLIWWCVVKRGDLYIPFIFVQDNGDSCSMIHVSKNVI